MLNAAVANNAPVTSPQAVIKLVDGAQRVELCVLAQMRLAVSPAL
jgi:hypothetical protein